MAKWQPPDRGPFPLQGGNNIANIDFIPVDAADRDTICRLSAFASAIVKQHFDPIIGTAQNDYMIERFQTPHAIVQQIRDGALYRLVIVDGELAGFVAFYPLTENGVRKLYVSKFYLSRTHRGRGIARQMFAYLCGQAAVCGADVLSLHVNRHNTDTIAVYEHLGFAVAGQVQTDIGGGFMMDDYVMEYRLL